MLKTSHRIFFQNSSKTEIPSDSIDLVVTSPPYPLVQMWDDLFIEQNPSIQLALENAEGQVAFELMHKELDKTWTDVYRLLKPGGIACINIGDATRKLGKDFQLYSNHSRILTFFLSLGFQNLPAIIWRKQTNAPNKFMGSGMMPPGAYMTLEHEFILILRKGGKRSFNSSDEKQIRRRSSYFWEERNCWFSDLWELKGTGQRLNDKKVRQRSAAYPFFLPYRLICMFSVLGDLVYDPFLGTGTSMLAAMVSGRNSLGIEIDPNFNEIIRTKVEKIIKFGNDLIRQRIEQHLEFVRNRKNAEKPLRYTNSAYNFPVVTAQEVELVFNKLVSIDKISSTHFEVNFDEDPKKAFERSRKSHKIKDFLS